MRMVRSTRRVWVALAAALTLYVGAFSTAAVQGLAQTPAPLPSAAQVIPFAGDWIVTVAMPGTQATFLVSIKNDGGKAMATVGSDTSPTVTVSSLSLSGNSLVLRYTTDYQGTPIPTI